MPSELQCAEASEAAQAKSLSRAKVWAWDPLSTVLAPRTGLSRPHEGRGSLRAEPGTTWPQRASLAFLKRTS